MKKISTKIFIVLIGLMTANDLFAHVVLEQKSAPANSGYKAVLMVGHGCEGSPTTGITVKIPEGFKGAKPMPKAGWNLSIKKEKLTKPYQSHGKEIAEDVTEITWTAMNREAYLPEAFYDEFIFRGTLPENAGALWFKVLQTCEKGHNDWSQIPASGIDIKDLKMPAALLEMTPAATPAHHH
jgi:uncharacterized protein YcnI